MLNRHFPSTPKKTSFTIIMTSDMELIRLVHEMSCKIASLEGKTGRCRPLLQAAVSKNVF